MSKISENLIKQIQLLKNKPSQQDNAIQACILLSRSRAEINRCFPQAEKFVRPGFDGSTD